MDTKGRLGKGKKEARREVESRKRAAITILSLRRLSFARQDQRDHLGRRWGFMYYIYLAVTFAGVTALVFLCLVALEMVIG